MTPAWLVFAQAIVGAVTREVAYALLSLADSIDPPPVSPRVKAERAVVAASPVPDVIPEWMVSES